MSWAPASISRTLYVVLTRLEINGFKSFQDFAWDLEPLVMVLGPNSAGKSNLFDAMALISRLSHMDLPSALRGGRGSIRDQFAHTCDGVAETMSFAVELLLGDTEASAPLAQTRFRYEVAVGRSILPSGIEELNVLREVLRPIARAGDEWMTSRPEFAKFARYDANDVLLAFGSDLSHWVTLTHDGVDVTPDDLRRVQSPRAAVTRDRAGGTHEIGGLMVRSVPFGRQ